MARRGDTFSATHWPRTGFPVRPATASAAYTPLTESGLVFYWDPDSVSAGTLSAITDQSTGGHNLSQATAGKRAVNTAAQFGTHRGLVFPSAANDGGYLFDASWAQPAACTIYCVVKYVATGATGQVLWQRSNSGTVGPCVSLCSISAGHNDRAQVYAGSETESVYSSAALVNGTTYVIKFGWDLSGGGATYVALNGGAVVTGPSDVAGAGTFTELGLSSAGVLDLVSVLGPQAMFNTWHDGTALDLRVTAYLKTWAGVA